MTLIQAALSDESRTIECKDAIRNAVREGDIEKAKELAGAKSLFTPDEIGGLHHQCRDVLEINGANNSAA